MPTRCSWAWLVWGCALLFCGGALLAGCREAAPTGAPGAPSPAEPALAPRFAPVPLGSAGWQGMTFGAAWGDYDGDGRVDLYTPCHWFGQGVRLLCNLGDGTFENRARREFSSIPADLDGDRHGPSFWDFDNDGDQDLAVMVGAQFGTGAEPSKFFVRDGDRYVNRAAALGLDYPKGRSRTLTMFDANGDGRLDALCAALKRGDAPTALFVQDVDGAQPRFVDQTAQSGLPSADCDFAQVTWLPDRGLMLFLDGSPTSLCALGPWPWRDVREEVGVPRNLRVKDAAWADFDGDGALDLFCACSGYGSDVVRLDDNTVRFTLNAMDRDLGVAVAAAGSITVALAGKLWRQEGGRPDPLDRGDVAIGALSHHPEALVFELDPQRPSNYVLQPTTPVLGVQVGLRPDDARVQVTVAAPRARLEGAVRGAAGLREWRPRGFTAQDPTRPDALLLWRDGRLERHLKAAGLDPHTDAQAVVAGDFDNDMDVDLFVVSSRPVSNPPDLFYENLGGARFRVHADGGGAGGTTRGRGDTVTTADFDDDGFLDLYVTNGEGDETLAKDGVDELFRGLPNGNHWLKIDLVGRQSNRDGIGARVWVEAGGVRQLRLADGGIHCFAQNHKRLHFGLGANGRVDRVTVDWPSGVQQTVDGCDADQTLTIEEPEG